MALDDEELYKSQPLVIPARINVSEPERIRRILEMIHQEIGDNLAISDKKPKTFLRNYLLLISTLRTVTEVAESAGAKDWVATGMKKTELAEIINRPRRTIDRKISSEIDFDKVLNDAEERKRKLQEKVSAKELGEKLNKTKLTSPKSEPKEEPRTENHPYGDNDYEIVDY